jgi:cytoskeletal protein CcmA (bactofilin family)
MSLLRIWVLLVFFCFGVSVYADESDRPKEESIVVLPAGAIHQGDFFATGRSVEISGTVDGDLYVFAGQVIIDGLVTGDVLGSGGSIDISGKVQGNCRLLAGSVLVSGDVEGNVSSVAGSVQCLSSAQLTGGLVAIAGNIDIGGDVGGNATVIASNVRVSSHIHHDLQGYMGKMRLTSKALIDGAVDYRSNTKAWIDPGAVVHGGVMYHPSIIHKIVAETWIYKVLVGSQVLVLLMNFIYTFVTGLVLMRFFPGNMQTTLHFLSTHPWKSLLYGALIVVLLPCVFLLLLITILGVPFALTLMAANVIGFYTAKVYTIAWGSNWLFSKMGLRQNRVPAYFYGVVLYFVLTMIPFVGPSLALIALLFGFGAGVFAQTSSLFSRSN